MTRTVRLHGFTPRERAVDVDEPATPETILRALDIRRDLVLVFANGEPVPDDAELPTEAEIRVVRVVSGGARRRTA